MKKNTYQRVSDLAEALREWVRFGRKGTPPKKVRANSSKTRERSRVARIKRDRVRRSITKSIQCNRSVKGRNIRTGK